MIRQITQDQNQYIQQIELQLSQSPTPALDYLVLAHNDETMLDRLTDSFSDESLAIVALPQSGWDMNEERFAELINWSIEEAQAKGILLVGHSQGGTPADRVNLVAGARRRSPQAETNPTVHSRMSLLDGVTRARHRVESCELHFVNQYQIVEKLALSAEHSEKQPLQLHGLFYRAEGGVFCLYEHSRFRALTS